MALFEEYSNTISQFENVWCQNSFNAKVKDYTKKNCQNNLWDYLAKYLNRVSESYCIGVHILPVVIA